MSNHGRIIVVSNRLPITVEATSEGKRLVPSSGGLVSALIPILKDRGGCWVGWAGAGNDDTSTELVASWGSKHGYSLATVALSPFEQAAYYRRFCNEIIWPLFHSVPSRCHFDAVAWRCYGSVNNKFADAVSDVTEPGDFIWVHDYHLMPCAGALRERGVRHRLAYFHHIPFPTPDIFEVLPWRVELLRALMDYDVVGFQTHRDRRNFIAALHRFLPDIRFHRSGEVSIVRNGDRSTTIGTYPISIDSQSFLSASLKPAVARAATTIRSRLGATRVLLGIDRLDYTKGIPERLAAFGKLLEQAPHLRGQVTFVQIVVPSREDIADYQQLRQRIETLVSKINGAYGVPGWVPINYFYRSVSFDELVAFYRVADIALVTPLKDGMNLVAKEFCASRLDKEGVLVLSEFAGAADELKCGALLINPHDTEGFAEILETALAMDPSAQRARMRTMQAQIRDHDVFYWCRSVIAGRMSQCVAASDGLAQLVS